MLLERLVAAVEAIFDERGRHTVPVLTAVEEGADPEGTHVLPAVERLRCARPEQI
jgi:hypothetical protein